MVVDKNTFSEWDTNIEESNPCEYPGYEEKIQNLKRKTNLDEAVITGIGKIDGMTFFVKDAVIGDEIEARITKLKKNYGYARVEQILKSSEFRTEPKCELHRRCGGCQIQAMA